MLKVIMSNNDTLAYAKALEIIEGENFKAEDLVEQAEFEPILTSGLFGTINPILIRVDSLKALKKQFKGKETEDQCVVVIFNNYRSAKGLTSYIEDIGGEVISLKDFNIKDALKTFPLKKDVLDIITIHIGDTQEKILPLISSLKGMTDKEIKDLTVDTVYSIMPNRPGEVPPYTYMNYMWRGDMDRMIFELDRILENSHPLVPFIFLKRGIDQLNKISMFYMLGYTSINSIKDESGINYYAIKNILPYAKNRKDVERTVILVTELEDRLKSSNVLVLEDILKKYIIQIFYILKGVL